VTRYACIIGPDHKPVGGFVISRDFPLSFAWEMARAAPGHDVEIVKHGPLGPELVETKQPRRPRRCGGQVDETNA
jgi:hypothetical protein